MGSGGGDPMPKQRPNHKPAVPPPAEEMVIEEQAPVEEKRVDPETGKRMSLRELHDFYAGQYKSHEVDEYWKSCTSDAGAAGTVGGSAQAVAPRAATTVPSAKTEGAPKAHWGSGGRRRF